MYIMYTFIIVACILHTPGGMKLRSTALLTSVMLNFATPTST